MPLPRRRASALIAGLVASVNKWTEQTLPDGSQVTFYVISCIKEGVVWETQRRYSEFHTLHESTAGQVELVSPFPPKITSISALTEAQKLERCTAINVWVKELIMKTLPAGLTAQINRFFDVTTHLDSSYVAGSSMQRHAPGKILFKGYVNKLGGNKDDPYNTSKGAWNRRFMVLQDDLRYFLDEKVYDRGGPAKGEISLDSFTVTNDDAPNMFTIHACPWPLVCRTDTPMECQAWVDKLNAFAFQGF